MNTISIIISCILSLIMARIIDLKGSYIKLFLIVLWVIGCINLIIYSLIFTGIILSSQEILYTVVIINGVLTCIPTPLYMELVSETFYPISEGTLGLILQTLSNLFGVVFVALIALQNADTSWMNWCLIGSAIIGLILAIFLKESYLRSNLDKSI
ncbi:disrupted in renal carcinoma protein 2 homolog [Centruroides sculpturatus]|uniref:disrupted in renal carcinoma protein 2 homolog n=1 Tax=Centruroides sculpturatus TaxID=218467 RepID=UPI000C6D9091|nr:disrupted in renal carcinoma protein 2 homolog [Centruroides sculpturatus]